MQRQCGYYSLPAREFSKLLLFYYLSLVKLIVVDSGDQFVQLEQLLLVGSLAWLGIRQLRASATRRVFNLSLSENLTDLFLNVLIPL